MPTQKLTPQLIEAALLGFEQQKRRIDVQMAELRQMLDGQHTDAADATPETAPRKRKKFSAASRRRMALAQKARWANIKGQSAQPAATPAESKRKRRISKEGMARIVAATKARWARVRAEKAQAARKKTARKTTAKKAAAKKTAPAAGTAQAAG